MKKFEKYIFKPRVVAELPHHRTMRNVPVFVDNELCEEANIWIMIPKIPKMLKNKVGAAEEPHVHDVAQIYCFEQDITAEVFLGETPDKMESHVVRAPSSVYIPAKMYHTLSFMETGENPVGVSILLKGNYEK